MRPGKDKLETVRARLLSGFTGEIPLRRPAPGYLLAAIVVAITMVLLAAAYLALVGLVVRASTSSSR